MTNDPLMNQCRKEAEERYPKPLSTAEAMRDSWNEHIAKFEREAYAAGLYHERSKPKREGLSDEEIERMADEAGYTKPDKDATLQVAARILTHRSDFKNGIRHARDHYAPPGTLTVEQAVEVVLKWLDEGTFQYDPHLDKQALRQALTAKARG